MVDIQVEVDSLTDPKRGGWVPVGTDGSYRLSGVPDNRFVKIMEVNTFNVAEPAARYRFCGTNTVTHGDTTLDVPLFLPGAALPTPILSGRVFTVIDGTPTPLAGKVVAYASRAYGPDVSGFTDRDGRYSLCGIPRGRGSLFMGCDTVEYTAYRQVVDVQGDTTIDIDATSFRACLYP